ncbi:hypothetical protein GUJ93_ZPchr0014g46915 [Zizania palustris]|uniref:Uncharacterized protein n=1 Tax=Zizania palustris TaxID=103762 RepID=A0A8J5T8C6_ZIZPA|nr:hypothetical protein GUJ93_ZPchr0014g46915 [Zizania palustris]
MAFGRPSLRYDPTRVPSPVGLQCPRPPAANVATGRGQDHVSPSRTRRPSEGPCRAIVPHCSDSVVEGPGILLSRPNLALPDEIPGDSVTSAEPAPLQSSA